MSTQPSDPLDTLRERLKEARKRHNTGDSLYYNGGTILVLLFTSAASLIPTIADQHEKLRWLIVIGQIAAAGAAILVGTERSLSLGARWRYHLEMQSAYDSLLDMLEFVPSEEGDRKKYLADLSEELKLVRRREAGIPGSGVADATAKSRRARL